MKKVITLLLASIFLFSCEKNENFVLRGSIGKDNRVLVVAKSSLWMGDVGKTIRTILGEPIVGLPQPEPQLTLSQVAPKGFNNLMNGTRNILILEDGKEAGFKVVKNKYSQPQTIVIISGKDADELKKQVKKYGQKIIKIFKDSDIKVIQQRFKKNLFDISKLKTLKNLGISLLIPKSFRVVDDTGNFLWMRQHLKSGIARGDGSNNLLVYSYPLEDESKIAENINQMRDTIGKKHIPGSDEGMYMITEKAYTPFTVETTIDGKKAYETRGKWEVKNDFMAGPFVNYTVIDKKHNRVIVVEGFTYAPAVNKRDFIFELEAIARSLKIKE